MISARSLLIYSLTPIGIILFCWSAWYGIFWCIDKGWGWHLLVGVCAVLLAILMIPGPLITDAPDDA